MFLVDLLDGSTSSLAFLSSVLLLGKVKGNPLNIFGEKLQIEQYLLQFLPKIFRCLVVFKSLGGKLRAVLPGSLTYPGAFTGRFTPAKGKNYATGGVKRKLAWMAYIIQSVSDTGCQHVWTMLSVPDNVRDGSWQSPEKVNT